MKEELSFSDARQDVFTLNLFEKAGFFLDLGCSDGSSRSNTLLLEQNGWTGLLFDSNPPDLNLARERRSSPCILRDLSASSIKEVLDAHSCPRVIDYVSLDIDQASFECLKRFPFGDYEFKFMTFEHDSYANRSDTVERKIEAPKLLHSLGYSTLVEDVICNGLPYEDWFINPKFFTTDLIQKYHKMKGIDFKDIPLPNQY